MVFVTRLIQPGGKSYNPVFAENEWSDIIEACHANEVPDEWVADGTKPTIDVPVSIEVLLDSRVEDIEAELQSDGSYISKYSGEEIDELLDKVSAT